MICPNCERKARWTRRRCAACQTRFPAWYVTTAVIIVVVVYLAYLGVDYIF